MQIPINSRSQHTAEIIDLEQERRRRGLGVTRIVNEIGDQTLNHGNTLRYNPPLDRSDLNQMVLNLLEIDTNTSILFKTRGGIIFPLILNKVPLKLHNDAKSVNELYLNDSAYNAHNQVKQKYYINPALQK